MKKGNKTTKFPVARIKKIMQKDEEVGKVAQATPVVISKALELFLAMIVDEAGKVAVSRNSKKVEAYHLKSAIDTCEMLDFLKEIVVNVPDPSAGGTVVVDGENAPKKRGRKRGTAATLSLTPAGEGEKDAPKKRRRRRKAKGDGQVIEERGLDEDEETGDGLSRRTEENWDDDEE